MIDIEKWGKDAEKLMEEKPFEWKLPNPPQPIVLEYDLKVPEEGESSEKLGYLEQFIVPGDVIGILDKKGKFILKMLYDKHLCLIAINNYGELFLLKSGTKLYKAYHVFLG